MKAETFFTMFQDRDPDAEVYVTVAGVHLAIVSARYDPRTPDNPPRVVLGVNRDHVLHLLEELAKQAEEQA